MNQPNFAVTSVYEYELFALNGTKLRCGFMNEKAWSKTIENNALWEYIKENKRVVEFAVDECIPDVKKAKIEGNKIRIPLKKEEKKSSNVDIPLEGVFHYLEQTILQRKNEMPENSYTTHLFQKGEEKILKKLGEETIEVILARDSKKDTVYETADLLYHLMVFLVEKEIPFDLVLEELKRRM